MIKILLLLFIITLPTAILKSEINLIESGNQAETLWQAHDFAAAERIYKQLLSHPLPNWQKARLLYNLGTVQLSGGHPVEALTNFQQIHAENLSLPQFAGQLYLNEGIAYLQYAGQLEKQALFNQQAIFIEQGIKVLKQAQQIECELKRKEGGNSTAEIPCISSPNVDYWTNTARSQLDTVLQQSRQQWIKEATEEMKEDLRTKKSANATSQLQASSLLEEQDPLQVLRLNYGTFLLHDPLSVDELKQLIKQFEQLSKGEKRNSAVNQVIELMQKGLENLNQNRPVQAKFHLLAGFALLDTLFSNNDDSPARILRRAIRQEDIAMQLLLLSELIKQEDPDADMMSKILISQHHQTIAQADRLIPAILKKQDVDFHQNSKENSACQATPWDQAVPLFARGYQAAQKSGEQLGQLSSANKPMIIALVEQTLQDWRQALKLILNPPKNDQSSPANQKFAETARNIQEMYLQDQAKPEEAVMELHSW